jgi:tetratricopeptide (TPR) repeat protein
MTNDNWSKRVAEVWDLADELGDNILLEKIDALVAERPDTDAVAAYEAGSVRDTLGIEGAAAPFYAKALELGIEDPQRTQLLIQYASTLRNLGRYDEALELLDRIVPEHPLADSAAATRALVLTDLGRTVEAVSVALSALAPHLPRYNRSMANYAKALLTD